MSRKPLHPTSYRPPLNCGGHNHTALIGDVPVEGQIVPERRTVGWRCRCGHTATSERLSVDRLNAAAWAPCLLAVVALPSGGAA